MTTVVIPYRDREDHLSVFIPAIRKKLPDATVLVVEQAKGKPFNRGKLLNIGAQIAFGQLGSTHIITHDVDMIPIEDTQYGVGDAVHLATGATQFGGKMPYDRYFGGVTVFSSKMFYMMNGYSNEYWGWGAEDDDALMRVESVGGNVVRPDHPNRFKSLTHRHALESVDAKKTHKANCERLYSDYDRSNDGLNTLEYRVLSQSEAGDVNHIIVEI